MLKMSKMKEALSGCRVGLSFLGAIFWFLAVIAAALGIWMVCGMLALKDFMASMAYRAMRDERSMPGV